MMPPLEAFSIMLIVIVVLCIFRIQQKKEQANQIARRFCRRNNLQFLDGTAAFQGVHFDRSSFMPVYRFRFEYSAMSTDRAVGSVSFVGRHVQNVFVDPKHILPESSDFIM